MKRRSEHLVQKRDGRTEFLRATKLARSIHLALQSVGVDEDWRAIEIGAAVLAGVRQRSDLPSKAGSAVSSDSASTVHEAEPLVGDDGSVPRRGVTLTTEMLADAVQRVLVANGQAAAAVAFGAVATERSRRRSSMARMGREQVAEGLAYLPSGSAALPRRLPKE